MKVRTSAVLPAPIDRAWDRLLDWEGQASWMADVDFVRVLSSRREGPGVLIAVRTRVLNVPLFTERLEVTVWDPPRRLVMAHRSSVRGVGEWRLEPTGAGTRFTWTEDLSFPVPMLGEVALLLYRPFLRRLMDRAAKVLRGLLAEGSPPRSA